MGERGSLRHSAVELVDAVLAIAFGACCAACGEPLEHPSRGPVCETCWRTVDTSVPSVFAVSPALADSQAIGLYDGALRGVIHAFKYEGRRSLAAALAMRMRTRCSTALIGADAVVPVPLHHTRRRQRGFNQALDLARHLGPPVVPAVRRIRATRSQTELSEIERQRNVRSAFGPSRRPWVRRGIAGRVVVIVDDVCTTGATLHECAEVLKALGAVQIRALTAARVATSPR